MPIHHALVFVLLMLPGTSLRDWQQHAGPNLRHVMQHGAIGLMNARTAEKDEITPDAAIRTIDAGARMAANNRVAIPYATDLRNLSGSLKKADVAITDDPYFEPKTNPARAFSDPGERILVFEPFGGGIEGADRIIGDWIHDSRCRLLVLSTNPSPAAYAAKDRLCPIGLYGEGIAHGFLTSPSTHTPGLVTNTDIAPTIAAYFGAKLRTPAFGAPITVQASDGDVVAILARRNAGYVRQAKLIGYVPYVAGCIALILALSSWMILRRNAAAGVLTAVVLAIPTLMLFTDPRPYFVVSSAILICFVMWKKAPLVYALPCVIAAVVLDDALLHHGQFSGASMLGYTPSEGARYYGVGNEVMGLWIGATTYICCTIAAHPKLKWAALVLALAVIAALGLPDAGAKAGGFLVGLLALAAALWTRSGRMVKPGVAIVGGVGVLVAGVVALIVMGRLFGASHVTQTMGMARSQGFGAIASVIERKAGMDAHLVFHSVWMIVLLVSSVATFVALRSIWRSPDLPRAEAYALTTATAAALLLNDAGVAAAALCSLTLWSSAMLLFQRCRLAADTQPAQSG